MLSSRVMKWSLTLVCIAGLSYAVAGEETGITEDNIVGAIDPAAEKRLGELILANVLRTYSSSANQAQIRLVNEVGYRILHAVDDNALVDDWQFIVINSEKSNAFSLPGGKIIISTAFLRDLTADGKVDLGMLAAILGHEIAHTRMHHFIANLRNRAALTWVIDNLGRLNSETAAQWTEQQKDRIGELVRARFTREQEFEADELGSLYAALAGYGFDGTIRSLQRELKTSGDFSQNEYLPTLRTDGQARAVDHPTWSERIAKVQSFQGRLLNVAGEFTWGNEMLRVGNLNKAIQCFKDVVAVFPNCFEAWNNLGNVYHLRYLQGRKVAELGFQTQLVNYNRDLRETVRGSNGLQSAIQAYRRAKELDPARSGVRLNLATALIYDAQINRANRGEDLGEAGLLLDAVLTKDPDNPQFLNAKAVLLHETDAPAETRQRRSVEIKDLFQKAAAQHYLPAEFNLAVVQFKSGNTAEGAAGLQQYLQRDSLSRWAALARGLLHSNHIETPKAESASVSPVSSVLGVQLGVEPRKVTDTLGKPERIVQCTTADGSEGEIYWYYSLGVACVMSEGRVESINLFAQPQPDRPAAIAETPPPPELAGVSIGATVNILEDSLGKAAQVRQAHDGVEKIYSYVRDPMQIDFSVQRSKIYLITLHKRA
jgi:predicted Zn-dependent protease